MENPCNRLLTSELKLKFKTCNYIAIMFRIQFIKTKGFVLIVFSTMFFFLIAFGLTHYTLHLEYDKILTNSGNRTNKNVCCERNKEFERS